MLYGIELAGLGLLAGLITTVAGMGGGMTLLLALAVLRGPQEALAVTAPALLVGNLHRLWMFRTHLDKRLAGALAVGALPGSILGGVFAVAAPRDVLHWIMLAMTAAALARAVGWWRPRVSPTLVLPAAFGTGMVCATSGGAGFLMSPILLAAGLVGEAFLATSAVTAITMHAGRLIGYSAGGMVEASMWPAAALLAVCIAGGNRLGKSVRLLLNGRLDGKLEYAALCLCLGLALAGVA